MGQADSQDIWHIDINHFNYNIYFKYMKILQKTSSGKFKEKYDYRDLLEISIDGKVEFNFLDGEPEDSNLRRDYKDCYNIVSIIERAYNAGKNGEELLIERKEIDDWEE